MPARTRTAGTPAALVTIVTVVRNRVTTIGRCLASIHAQDFDDFEHVVIDGASTDGTTAVIEPYADRLAYYHSRRDRNAAEGFNAGVEHSGGRWVLFINSDDQLRDPGVLSRMAPMLVRHAGDDVVLGQVIKEIAGTDPPSFAPPVGHAFSWSKFLRRNIIHHQAAFNNRDFLARVGQFDERYKVAFDYDFYLRGGPSLRVTFVPIEVSIMDAGGLSSNVGRILSEYRDARIATGAVPRWRAHLRYGLGRVRAAGGRVYHPLLAWWLNRRARLSGAARPRAGTEPSTP